MSASDRPDRGRWVDRRAGGERRARSERRTAGAGAAGGEERRVAPRRGGRDRRDETGWAPVPLDAGGAALTDDALLAAATAARARAHAQYSGFKVGAALETIDGTIVTGCNIENATYGLTVCAERVALLKALSEGHAAFVRIAIVADAADPVPPCGACRQLLWEYGGDLEILLGNLATATSRHRLSALLPLPFDRTLLK